MERHSRWWLGVALGFLAWTMQGVALAAPTDLGPTVDDDGDGFTENEGDCDDADELVNPEMPEIPQNLVDDNCNGQVDEEDLILPVNAFLLVNFDLQTRYFKVHYTQTTDLSTFQPSELYGYNNQVGLNAATALGWVGGVGTCNGATVTDPTPANGKILPQCAPTNMMDLNFATAASVTLDKAQRSVGAGYSAATSLAGVVIFDNDCTTALNKDHLELWVSNDNLAWTRVDGAASYFFACGEPVPDMSEGLDNDADGYLELEGDCNDSNATIFPGAPELEDGRDNNCDGRVDEGTSKVDDDGDGYSEAQGDCDDSDLSISPIGTEVLNGKDDDCDDQVDERLVTHQVQEGESLQDVITGAQPWDRVEVGAGTYGPIDLQGKDLEIIAVAGPELTVIEGGDAGMTFANGETPACHLEGFTIRGARKHGLYIENASPTLVDLRVEDCGDDAENGGGAYITGELALPDLTECHFKRNRGYRGGGFYVVARAHPRFHRCPFGENVAISRGGGGYLGGESWVELEDCSLSDATAGEDGGGFYLESSTRFQVVRLLIERCGAGRHGGGGWIGQGALLEGDGLDFTECQAGEHGGALYLDAGGRCQLTSCNYVGNHCGGRGGACYLGSGAVYGHDGGLAESNVSTGDGGIFFLEPDAVVTGANLLGKFSQAGGRGGVACVGRGGRFNCQICQFHENQATGEGGVLYLEEENVVELTDVELVLNQSSEGGALWFGPRGQLGCTRCFLDRNHCPGRGGAIFSSNDMVLNFEDLETTGCSGSEGGAFWLGPGHHFTCNVCAFTENMAGGNGGALFLSEGTSSCGCKFRDNVADGDGGGWYIQQGSKASCQKCKFEGNQAQWGGGVAARDRVSLQFINTSFVSNIGYEEGGALSLRDETDLEADACTFDANQSGGSGAAISARGGFLAYPHRCSVCTVTNGDAQGDGGGFAYQGVPLEVVDSTFQGNHCGGRGGHLYLGYVAHTVVSQTRFLSGLAGQNGGGICQEGAELQVNRSTFQENLAGGEGGGVYSRGPFPLAMVNNTLVGNGAPLGGGVRACPCPSVPRLELVNNLIAYTRQGRGVVIEEEPAERVVAYNDFFENGGGDCGCVGGDPVGVNGNFSQDPQLTAYAGDPETDDLSLKVSSPLINAGDPNRLDGDGSRSDVGHAGGVRDEASLTDQDADGDGISYLEGDCDDQSAQVGPGQTEVWGNGVDENCDGMVADQDGDGVLGSALGGADCDDTDATIGPNASEVLGNLIDEDCDGVASDMDGDGELSEDEGGTDCDDEDPSRAAGLTEIFGNADDEDCDGLASDQDGDGELGVAEGGLDCEDTDPGRNSQALEVPDGVDQDCDELVDEGTTAYDDDGDGQSEQEGDCNDGEPTIYLGAAEVANDGVDQDCDGHDLVVVDTPTPGDDDTTAPGDDDTTAPGDDDTTAPGDDDTTAPGDDDTTAPGDDDTTAPGDDDTTAPGDDDATGLVDGNLQGGGCTCQSENTSAGLPGGAWMLALLAGLGLRRRR